MFVKVRSLIYAAEFIIKFTAGEEQYFYCLRVASLLSIVVKGEMGTGRQRGWLQPPALEGLPVRTERCVRATAEQRGGRHAPHTHLLWGPAIRDPLNICD